MEAFKVLPAVGGPGPPAPASPRVAPRVRQHKEASAFVVLGELGAAAGRPPASPFRGRGFRGAPSRIPVMSAPSSPVRRPQPPAGKSAPASPSKPRPAKRVTARPPAPRPRQAQPAKEEPRPKAAVRKPQPEKQQDKPQPPPPKSNSNDEQQPPKVVTTTYDRFGRPVVSNASLKKRKQTVAKMNDPERLNGRPRPTDKPLTNGRTITRQRNSTLRPKKEVTDVMRKSEESLLKAEGPTPNKTTNGINGSTNSLANSIRGSSNSLLNGTRGSSNSLANSVRGSSNSLANGTRGSSNSLANGVRGSSNSLANGVRGSSNNLALPSDTNEKSVNGNTASDRFSPPPSTRSTDPEIDNNNKGPKEPLIILENVPANNNDVYKVPQSDVNHLNVEKAPGKTIAAGGEVPKSPDAVSLAEMLTGSTTADVEPVKESPKVAPKAEPTTEPPKMVEEKQVQEKDGGDEAKEKKEEKHVPNGTLPEGGLSNGVIQNKIIIHQSDRNGGVQVIGSVERQDLDEILRESIRTETAVPSGELLETRPDLIPSGEEEVRGTVTGDPDVEVQQAAARNSVSFRAGVMRVTSSKPHHAQPQPPPKRKFGFPFAPFPAKKFINLGRKKKAKQVRPPSSTRRMSTLLGLTSLGRKSHSKPPSRRFTGLAKLTVSLGGRKQPVQSRPPSARKFSAVATITKMGVTGEVRPDWTVQEDEPEYVSCCCCRRANNNGESGERIIRSKSLERMETLDKEENLSEEGKKQKKSKKKKCCLCCCGSAGSEEDVNDNENKSGEGEAEKEEKPSKPKKKLSCWGRQDSSDDVRSNGTKLSEVQLLPGKLETEGGKTKGEQWAVKTNSQEAQDYIPPKKKKKRCFWCCYKTEESRKVADITKTSQLQQPTEQPKQKTPEAKPKGKNIKLKSQDSKQSELDCNRKCKFCWLCCCCGCTCSTKPHMKSMAIQAMSTDIRASMMLIPGQLRIPTPNDSGDAMVIQSVSSADNRFLTAARKTSSQGTSKDITAIGSMLSGKQPSKKMGASPERPPLDPTVQRSVSAVMRHLSPERKGKGCSCFSCKKSPDVHRKSVKRKTNWMCCTARKKKKTSSQEKLTSISKLPPEGEPQPKPKPQKKSRKKKSTTSCWGKKKSPEIHPVSARKRKRTLGERLCSWRKTEGKVPLKASRRGCCGWLKKKKAPPQPAKERRTLKEILCCKSKKDKSKDQPKSQPKQGLCRRMFCCCYKPKLAPVTTASGEQAAAPPPPPPGKRNELPPIKPLTRPNVWKRIFCCKCQRSPDMGSRKSYGSKRGDMASRASSLASFPKLEATLVEHSSMMKAAIPVLPICLAWTCLIINVFIPGAGTILSGFLCVCFGKPRFSVKDSTFARLGALCVNIVIGVGQMFTVIFCFVGWGWSIWWGVIMLRLARKYRRIKQAEQNPQDSEAPEVPHTPH